jgi:hypothetical protein
VIGRGLSTTGCIQSVAAAVKCGILGLCTGASGQTPEKLRSTRGRSDAVVRQVTFDRTRQVTSGCLLETTGRWHCGVRYVKLARQVMVSRVRAMRDLCVRSWLADASSRLVIVGGSSGHS